jgi:hypothetical protein
MWSRDRGDVLSLVPFGVFAKDTNRSGPNAMQRQQIVPVGASSSSSVV